MATEDEVWFARVTPTERAKAIVKAPLPRIKKAVTTKKALIGYTIVGTASIQQALNKIDPGCGDAVADVISSMSSFVIQGFISIDQGRPICHR